MAFTWWLYPARRFDLDGRRYALRARARTDGLVTHLDRDGTRMSSDRTPLVGPEAVRNHEHRVALSDGRTLDLEAGYLGPWSLGIHARIDGASVHESHPGRTLAFPEAYREQTVGMSSISGELKKNWNDGLKEGAASTGWTQERWRANRLPLAIDIACGLLFFVLAKAFGLTTAAIAMASVGIALVIGQRLTRLDLTGGLALFGIAVSLLGAMYAWFFQDEELIKLRGTIIGSFTASLFLLDGLFGGRRLADKLMRYMPYPDMHAGRLGIGMGVMGLVMAGLNLAVVRLASTDTWLLYTTFFDVPLVFAMMLVVMLYARGRLFARRP